MQTLNASARIKASKFHEAATKKFMNAVDDVFANSEIEASHVSSGDGLFLQLDDKYKPQHVLDALKKAGAAFKGSDHGVYRLRRHMVGYDIILDYDPNKSRIKFTPFWG